MAKKTEFKVRDMISVIEEVINGIVSDATAFDEKGNKAAAKRVRAELMEIKKNCDAIRKAIQEKVNGMKFNK